MITLRHLTTFITVGCLTLSACGSDKAAQDTATPDSTATSNSTAPADNGANTSATTGGSGDTNASPGDSGDSGSGETPGEFTPTPPSATVTVPGDGIAFAKLAPTGSQFAVATGKQLSVDPVTVSVFDAANGSTVAEFSIERDDPSTWLGEWSNAGLVLNGKGDTTPVLSPTGDPAGTASTCGGSLELNVASGDWVAQLYPDKWCSVNVATGETIEVDAPISILRARLNGGANGGPALVTNQAGEAWDLDLATLTATPIDGGVTAALGILPDSDYVNAKITAVSADRSTYAAAVNDTTAGTQYTAVIRNGTVAAKIVTREGYLTADGSAFILAEGNTFNIWNLG